MSYSGFDATLVCEARVSRALVAGTALAYALPVAAALVTLPASAGGPVAVLALAAGARELRRLSRRPPVLYWGRDGRWRRGDPEGPPLDLDAATWSSPCLIVLVLRGPGGTLRVPLACDAVDGVTWRRLRARLQIGGATAGEPA